MAKKKVVKVVKKVAEKEVVNPVEVSDSEMITKLQVRIVKLSDLVLQTALATTEVNERIDRLVTAIDKSKKVTGI